MSWERGALISEKLRIEIGKMDAAIKLHFTAGRVTSCTLEGCGGPKSAGLESKWGGAAIRKWGPTNAFG